MRKQRSSGRRFKSAFPHVKSIKQLEKEVEEIKERNKRVEADKAWETSTLRRLVIAVATYVVILYFLILIEAPTPELVALVPAGAYLIQQYSMPFIKEIWVKKVYRE